MLPGFLTEPETRGSGYRSPQQPTLRRRSDRFVPQWDEFTVGEGGEVGGRGPLRSHPQVLQCPGCAVIRCGFLGLQSCLTCC